MSDIRLAGVTLLVAMASAGKFESLAKHRLIVMRDILRDQLRKVAVEVIRSFWVCLRQNVSLLKR